jgi:hypothetical protein
MDFYGNASFRDSTHVFQAEGLVSVIGDGSCNDSVYACSSIGWIISDSVTYSSAGSFTQGTFLSTSDMTMNLTDWTYTGGYWDSTVLRDCTRINRWFDATWINYSTWRTIDASNKVLIGYRYREPVHPNVGNYYAPMEVPGPGQYDLVWRYQKDSSAYVREKKVPFTSLSDGVTATPV